MPHPSFLPLDSQPPGLAIHDLFDVNIPRFLESDDLYGLQINSSAIPETELSRFSRPLLDFAATMTVIIMITGIFGNLLTIIALVMCPRVRNVAAAFIISLCVADFIFCIAVLPFSSSRFIHGTWIHGTALCVFFPFMRYGNIGVSLLSIAMITINRYIMIAHHGIYNRIYTKTWIAAMMVFCWLFSYGMQLPTLFGVWGKFGYEENLGSCSIKEVNGRSAKTFLFCLAFIVPCIVIICCYARIFWVVHQSESRIRKHAVGSSRPLGRDLNPGSKTKEQKELKAKRNEWRITKMVLVIFCSFVICYLPITIVKVTDSKVAYPGFHVMGYLMLYLSACINPIIYVIMNKQYRQAYKTVLLWKRPRMLSISGPPSAPEKSLDGISKTMVSHVSIALTPISLKPEEHPDVFDDKL